MTQKSSAFVFTSGSSVQVASSVCTQTDVPRKAGAQVHGAAKISMNGVSLEAIYRLEPEGLSVVVGGFDDADPDGTRVHERLLLKLGERRVIRVRRAYHKSPIHFTITRIGDGAQISANSS
jgi:hypothetical protein